MVGKLETEMIEVSLDQVPKYLQQGEYFRTLSDNDDGLFSVPGSVLKADPSISDSNDLEHLLLSLQFWIACTKERKQSIITYMMTSDLGDDLRLLVEEYQIAFPFLHVTWVALTMTLERYCEGFPSPLVQYVLQRHATAVAILMFLSEHDRLRNRLPNAKENDQMVRTFLDTYTVECVADEGELDLLQLLFEHHIITSSLCYHSAKSGHLACLEYLVDQDMPLREHPSIVAASNGHLHVLKFLHKNNKPLDAQCCRHAAERGHLACLQYLLSIGHPWGTLVTSYAARNGHIDCLAFAHENGCPWDGSVCRDAASNGHLQCLQYARDHGCPWDPSVCDTAAEGGHLDCLQYAFENGCPWDSFTCSAAASNGHLVCLQFAHENGCPWDAATCTNAARGGHLECLAYAHTHGCRWDGLTCSSAAGGGHLGCLQYAREHGCPWDAETCYYAALNGHLDCLQYAHTHGCGWSSDTSHAAVCSLSCLMYALQHGCAYLPHLAMDAFTAEQDSSGFYILQHCTNLDNRICNFAAKAGRLDILEACAKAGVAWHEDTVSIASAFGHSECVEFLLAHGARV